MGIVVRLTKGVARMLRELAEEGTQRWRPAAGHEGYEPLAAGEDGDVGESADEG